MSKVRKATPKKAVGLEAIKNIQDSGLWDTLDDATKQTLRESLKVDSYAELELFLEKQTRESVLDYLLVILHYIATQEAGTFISIDFEEAYLDFYKTYIEGADIKKLRTIASKVNIKPPRTKKKGDEEDDDSVVNEYANIRFRLLCAIAVRLPTINDKTAKIIIIGCQSAVRGNKPPTKRRKTKANAANLGAPAIKSVTAVGAP